MPELQKKVHDARRAMDRKLQKCAARMCRFVHQRKYRVAMYGFDPSNCVCYGEFWGFEEASSGEKNIFYIVSVILAGRLGAIFLQTGWVARVVLLILLFLSLFSWAIILQKYRMFATLEPRTKRFMQLFRTGRGLPDPNTLRAGSSGSPFVNVYDAGYRELEGQLAGGNPHPGKLKNPRAVLVEMQLASADEVRYMESWMPWLATIGSISTFIGLFGTVWGVMDAFAGLSEVGQASLQAVAPGIADALITTAAGLFAAIPAVIAYNIYLHRIRDFALRMDNFATEFVSKIETLYS